MRGFYVRSDSYWERVGFKIQTKRDITFIILCIQFDVRTPNYGISSFARSWTPRVSDRWGLNCQTRATTSIWCVYYSPHHRVCRLAKETQEVEQVYEDSMLLSSFLWRVQKAACTVDVQRLKKCGELTVFSVELLFQLGAKDNIRRAWWKTPPDVCSSLFFWSVRSKWVAWCFKMGVELSWWRAEPCSRLSQDGAHERELDATIPAVRPLAPNDITSITWQLSHPRDFGLIRVQWEEVEHHPSVLMSTVQTALISSAFTWRV